MRDVLLSYGHLGSVRVTDQNANLIARHDYLPFGEEIPGNTAGRDSTFGAPDNVNQKFTGQERDAETNLDFFQARYYTSGVMRFMSPDPANAGADLSNPQSWNGYSYVWNNPLSATDPTGLIVDTNPIDSCAYVGTFDASCGAQWGLWPDGTPLYPLGTGGGDSGGGNGGGAASGSSSSTGASSATSQPFPPGSFPGGEVGGIPRGLSVPGPLSPQVLWGLWGWDCPGGICVPGLGPTGFADPDVQIKSLYDQILEHLEKIENDPYSQSLDHWRGDIRGFARQILKKSAKVTQKRSPGALDKYLQRVLGITGADLENLLSSPIVIVNPCIVPTLPFCRASPGGPPIG